MTRSISGHLTEKMQQHYSTVRGDEQKAGLAKVIDLVRTPKGVLLGGASEASGASGGALPPEVVLERKNRL